MKQKGVLEISYLLFILESTSLLYIFFKFMFYYTGLIGRPWQIQSTYLNMRNYKQKEKG